MGMGLWCSWLESLSLSLSAQFGGQTGCLEEVIFLNALYTSSILESEMLYKMLETEEF